MFYHHFAPSRLRSGFLPASPDSQRFGLSALPDEAREDGRGHTWKELYRISSNWRSGRAKSATVTLRESVLDSRLPLEITGEDAVPPVVPSSSPSRTDTIVQFHGSWIFTASRTPSTDGDPPAIQVHQTIAGSDSSRFLGYITSSSCPSSLGITEMRVDEAHYQKGFVRLAAFYINGQFSIFKVSTSVFSFSEEYASPTSQTSSGTGLSASHSNAATARFHFPLLVTCSTDFTLAFHILTQRDDKIEVSRAQPGMRSQMCWWPLVVSLAKVATPNEDKATRFKATIVYATPFYPSAWTIAVQEFDIVIPSTDAPTASVRARHATALPPGFAYSPSSRRHRRFTGDLPTSSGLAPGDGLAGMPSCLITGLEHSAPYVVVSRSDNTLDVFEIVDDVSSTAAMGGDPPLKVIHRRTLFGHTGSVGAVAVDGGRCVSGGEDGVKVWELDRAREDVELGFRIGLRKDQAVHVWDSAGRGSGERLSSPARTTSWLSLATPPSTGTSRRRSPSSPGASIIRTRPSPSPAPSSSPFGPSVRWLGFDGNKIVEVQKEMLQQQGTVVPGKESIRVLSFA